MTPRAAPVINGVSSAGRVAAAGMHGRRSLAAGTPCSGGSLLFLARTRGVLTHAARPGQVRSAVVQAEPVADLVACTLVETGRAGPVGTDVRGVIHVGGLDELPGDH